MKHDLGCNCHDCTVWFSAMQAYISRGRCRCGHPIDEHRMTSKGELVACPAIQGAHT